ncbi:hypothetical protein EDD18DRAFT_1357431 [Armillaria luteobubalina]|uniref:Uncharacterized protein n=1 Tax=Armillaria luteobubalina TaxID=153913 RepID=A0AA39P030_9AGAR|nr:hypothetical protein EDD18DRAFT_1367525 [Armillaria luteobubalina]KAK0493020.1 hypothetical protein EDD18DRAFT_1357431 [Armillaria luteobubalina]
MWSISPRAYGHIKDAYKAESVLWQRDRWHPFSGKELHDRLARIEPLMVKFRSSLIHDEPLPVEFRRFLATICRNISELDWSQCSPRWEVWGLSANESIRVIAAYGELSVLPAREDTPPPYASGPEDESDEDVATPPPPKRQKTNAHGKEAQSNQSDSDDASPLIQRHQASSPPTPMPVEEESSPSPRSLRSSPVASSSSNTQSLARGGKSIPRRIIQGKVPMNIRVAVEEESSPSPSSLPSNSVASSSFNTQSQAVGDPRVRRYALGEVLQSLRLELYGDVSPERRADILSAPVYQYPKSSLGKHSRE